VIVFVFVLVVILVDEWTGYARLGSGRAAVMWSIPLCGWGRPPREVRR
jgi:hypothetical protein